MAGGLPGGYVNPANVGPTGNNSVAQVRDATDLGPSLHLSKVVRVCSMYIDGIGIGGYRSFDHPMQFIGPLAKINLIIGKNNSGKSNVLRFLHEHYDTVIQAAKGHTGFQLGDLDRTRGSRHEEIEIAFARPVTEYDERRETVRPQLREALARLIAALESVGPGDGLAWFPYVCTEAAPTLQFGQKLYDLISHVLPGSDLPNLLQALDVPAREARQAQVGALLDLMAPVSSACPRVDLIPAVRKPDHEQKATDDDWSGLGIIDRLWKLESPDATQYADRERFDRIVEFVREVTGESEAGLQIPHTRKTINVTMNSRLLPLESLGTGVHEVIIIAAAATVLRNQVICIEEPELHLHPELQRKLLTYLASKTDNQYVISSHSAHLWDAGLAAVFHVRLEGGFSKVQQAISDADKFTICSDLGYRASDLLQANCIIWVEGPSDRTYIHHWLRKAAPELEEGLHHSIMFYGGRLLSHLSATDQEVTDFIDLRRLNQRMAIVMDSDREKSGQRMSTTKIRARNEMKERGFVWVTQGREIENYVPTAVLEDAVKKVHKKAVSLYSTGQYKHQLYYRDSGGKLHKEVDKVKVARAVAAKPADLGILDLRQQIGGLVRFIEDSNP